MGLMSNSSVKFQVQKTFQPHYKGSTIRLDVLQDDPCSEVWIDSLLWRIYYLQNRLHWNALLPRQFLESPITGFFSGARVSHYPQFVKAPASSGVITVCSHPKYNLQLSTLLESDEPGGKVGSSLHYLQIKSLDGVINPQTVRYNVERQLLASFGLSSIKQAFPTKTNPQLQFA